MIRQASNRACAGTAEHWRPVLERFERSELGVGQLFQAELISKAGFYRWRRRLTGSNCRHARVVKPAEFIELGALGEAGQAASWEVELALDASVVLRLRRS